MNLEIPFDVLLVPGQNVNDSEIGVAVLDSSMRFQFYNRAFANQLGLVSKSMIGLTNDEMVAWIRSHDSNLLSEWPTMGDWLGQVGRDNHAQSLRSFESSLKDERWIFTTQQSHENGMLVTLSTDVTEKKRVELALRTAHDELERLAMTDELTGVPNRRYFFAGLEKEYERIKRYGHTACLVMVDLDHFKRINDSHGHAAGDDVLKHFATILRNHVRVEDMAGRIGGEEFAILLPETTQDGAFAVLGRMRDELSNTPLAFIAPEFCYTFSAGIAEMTKDGPPCKDWMRLADEALYQAKAGGRNRAVVYQPH